MTTGNILIFMNFPHIGVADEHCLFMCVLKMWAHILQLVWQEHWQGFWTEMIYPSWGAKRKLSFIKCPIHAFQTRINSLSFCLCSSFNSVIMEQWFSDLFLPMWATDCTLWLADICLQENFSPLHCRSFQSRILANVSVQKSEKK